jgi:RimJ/RimL family protein N-acetyltransferase
MVATAKGHYLDVRDFEPADYLAIWDQIAGQFPSPRHLHPHRWAEEYAESGPAFTGWWHGHILACAGLMMPWPHLASAWAVLTPEGRRHPVMVHRTVRRFLDALAAAHQLRRIEAIAIEQDPRARRWLERLGFAIESRRPLWGPQGEAGINYVRFP